ncbi:hypothetical protein J6590_059096 [Homalodisca vitripennis]|nr:hypothetical protein J6590_059096 [Homalodisca vitripennis]
MEDAFRKLELLTLPCLYILEVALYCRSKCVLMRGIDIHSYETRGRENYRGQQHRTVAFERLPSQMTMVKENFVISASRKNTKATRRRQEQISVDSFMTSTKQIAAAGSLVLVAGLGGL